MPESDSSIASVSTKDNNESDLFLEDHIFISVGSVESVEEFIAFLLLERLNFVMFRVELFVDGADVNVLGNNLFVGGAGGRSELSLAFCCLLEHLGASAEYVTSSELSAVL